MLIGYSMPVVSAISLSSGSWLTADGGAACFDAKPARRARYTAPGAATVGLTFGTAAPIRVAAMLGVRGLAEGTGVSAVTIAGSSISTLQRFADGSLGCWFVLPLGPPAGGIEFTFSAGGVVDIGELVAMPAMELPAHIELEDHLEDSSVAIDTKGLQAAVVAGALRRALSFSVAPRSTDATYTGQQTLQALRFALGARRPSVVIPVTRTPAMGAGAPLNGPLIQQAAMYGHARTIGPITHVERGYWRMGIDFVERPAG